MVDFCYLLVGVRVKDYSIGKKFVRVVVAKQFIVSHLFFSNAKCLLGRWD